MNNETVFYDPVHINNTEDDNTIIYYNITGLHPSLSYTFTAYLSKTRSEDHIFCKLIILICLY